MKNNCYSCRNYYTDCEDHHDEKDLIRVKHKDGIFRWGDPEEDVGRWVKICRSCRDDLAQNGLY